MEKNHLAPLAVAAAIAKPGTLKTVADTGRSLVTSLGGYKNAQGPQHRKVAAAIKYLNSLGYSNQQIQHAPLRDYVIAISQWDEPIKDVVKPGFFVNGAGAFKKLVSNPPYPMGNTTTYAPPADGSGTDSIIAPVFGDVPKFGEKLTVADLERNRPNAAAASVPLSFNEKTQALIDTGISNVKPPAALQKDNVDMLIPLRPMMNDSLRAAGYIPPSDLTGTAMLFYEKIVQPAQANTYDSDFLDDAIVNSIMAFAATLAAKQREGEQLNNKVYEVIATLTNKATDTVQTKVEERAQFEVGRFISENIVMILLGVAAVFVLFFMLKKKK